MPSMLVSLHSFIFRKVMLCFFFFPSAVGDDLSLLVFLRKIFGVGNTAELVQLFRLANHFAEVDTV